MSKETAMFAVQRNGVDYKVSGFDIQLECQEGDLFYVQRGDTVYKWSRQEFNHPWETENHWFHVKNLTEELFVWPRDEPMHQIWNLDTNEKAERMLPGHQYMIGGYNDLGHKITFEGNSGNWDFGGTSNVDLFTEGARMFADCPNFNGDISPLLPTKWKNINEMFLNCRSFNQDISGWDITRIYNNWEVEGFLNGAANFVGDLSSWCMHAKADGSEIKLENFQWCKDTPIMFDSVKHPQWCCANHMRRRK